MRFPPGMFREILVQLVVLPIESRHLWTPPHLLQLCIVSWARLVVEKQVVQLHGHGVNRHGHPLQLAPNLLALGRVKARHIGRGGHQGAIVVRALDVDVAVRVMVRKYVAVALPEESAQLQVLVLSGLKV